MSAHDPISLWQRPEHSGAGPKPGYSRAGIAAAAIEVADNEGFAAVSIRRVAAALGTGPASLYRYLRSHDELVELMVDTVSGEYDLTPSEQSPRLQLVALALQARSIMLRHPWLADLLLTRPSMGPNTLRYLERALGALESVQLLGPAKLQTIAMLTAIISAFVKNEIATMATAEADAEGGIERVQYLAKVVQTGDYPLLAGALTTPPTTHRPDDMFTSVVGQYLTGAGLPATIA